MQVRVSLMCMSPIPAGCSFASKTVEVGETHREYAKNEVSIFLQKLTEGEHTFKVELLPRFKGNYVLNPGTVSFMYYPLNNANNEIKRVTIEKIAYNVLHNNTYFALVFIRNETKCFIGLFLVSFAQYIKDPSN